MPELLFHGAAQEVTGSMHMVHVDGAWIALDCGLFQGRRAEAEEKNRAWPLPPAEIAAVVVSHAHTDHTGRLPLLVKQGFSGPIYCTPATRDLCAFMLPDSAHIQQEDVFYLNKRRARKGLEPIAPLYELPDAIAALKLMQTVPNDRWFQPVNGLLARFNEAGHMLGSAGVHLEFGKRNGSTTSLYFTGDVGRPEAPILHDPARFPPCDYVISESTYGGRVNEDPENAREIVLEVIARTIARGGKVIMPAFAVGRTQTIIYYLYEQFLARRLPPVPVYVDSPMAYDASQVFSMHPELYDTDAQQVLQRPGLLLGAGCCTYIRDVEDSKALHERRDPCVIISTSGMCEAGRIRHHLKNNIENPLNTVLFPGFQAENTLGRRIVDGARKITLFGDEYTVRAEIVQINGFSGHADQRELLDLLAPLAAGCKAAFLVHGEMDQSTVLQQKLRQAGFQQVGIPPRGARVELA